jgi:hypothetical protein
MSATMLTVRELRVNTVEIVLCVGEQIPFDVTRIFCALVVRDDQRESNSSEIKKNCCVVGSWTSENHPRCHNSYYVGGDSSGASCDRCMQYICGDHKETHKFCFCGKQLFGKPEENKNTVFDPTKILHRLFQEPAREELEWYKEPEDVDSNDPDFEFESRPKTPYCCYRENIDWESGFENCGYRCGNHVEKFCSECEIGFCRDHFKGFCRCGKAISS